MHEHHEREFSLKRQVAAENFHPVCIKNNIHLFFDHIRGQTLSGHFHENFEWCDDTSIDDVGKKLQPYMQERAVHDIFLGMVRRYPVWVTYTSIQKKGDSVMSPHSIFYMNFRYYVRCYCHSRRSYRNFSLSRFTDARPAFDQEWVSNYDDEQWHEYEDLYFIPNPKLPMQTIFALRLDYNLAEGEYLHIRDRRAFSFFIRRELG